MKYKTNLVVTCECGRASKIHCLNCRFHGGSQRSCDSEDRFHWFRTNGVRYHTLEWIIIYLFYLSNSFKYFSCLTRYFPESLTRASRMIKVPPSCFTLSSSVTGSRFPPSLNLYHLKHQIWINTQSFSMKSIEIVQLSK